MNMKTESAAFLAMIVALCVALWPSERVQAQVARNPSAVKPRLIHNEDSDGATRNRAPAAGQVKPVTEKWFDDLFATTPTDLVIYCSALGDLVWLWNCPSGERVYTRPGLSSKPTGGTPTEDQIVEQRSLRELWQQKTDVLAIAVDRAHARAKLALAEMRMSDYHHGGVIAESYLCPKSVLDHPEWRIAPDVGLLDYSHQGVRDRYLAVLRDIVVNYQVDGIELNWQRFGRHFSGNQRQKAPILTAWLREIRAMLDDVANRRKRPRLLLTHILPATVEESLNIGCDVEQWIRSGLADIVMPMDFLHTDFNLRTEQFVALAKGTGCLVYPNVHESMGSAGHRITLDKHRALAANHYAWGADGIGTFNMYPQPMAWLGRVYPILGDPKSIAQGPRHYQFVRGTSASRPVQFAELNKRYVYTFRMADGRLGEKLTGVLRAYIEGPGSQTGDEFALDLNGTAIARDRIRLKFSAKAEEVPLAGADRPDAREVYPPGLRLEVSLRDCPPFRGDNELGMRWTKREAGNAAERRMQVMEVIVSGG